MEKKNDTMKDIKPLMYEKKFKLAAERSYNQRIVDIVKYIDDKETAVSAAELKDFFKYSDASFSNIINKIQEVRFVKRFRNQRKHTDKRYKMYISTGMLQHIQRAVKEYEAYYQNC